MSWDGFIPDWVEIKCKRCGKDLENKDSGYPSRALGIFNHLCYPCTREAPFLEKRFMDGAQLWSHPPDYDRRRRYFWCYTNCKNTKCQHGSVYVSRELGFGGPYQTQCEDCINKYNSHPARAHFEKMLGCLGRICYKVAEKKEKAIKRNKKLSPEEKEQKIKEMLREIRDRKDKVMNNLNEYKLTNYPKEVK